MTIPPDPTAGNTATPSFTTSPSQRPQAWTELDGTPITSAPADLFSAPRTEHLVSNGWTDVQAAALLEKAARRFTPAWIGIFPKPGAKTPLLEKAPHASTPSAAQRLPGANTQS